MKKAATLIGAALATVALAACGGNELETKSAGSLPECLAEAGLTVAQTRADLDQLEGINDGLDGPLSTGTAGFNATSFYNEEADPPWELLVVQKPEANGEEAPRVELSAVAKRFNDYAAAA